MSNKKEPLGIQKIPFDKLGDLFKKRIFAIPEIQREFVWTKTKVIDLLDSIRKHYPIGSFLICKVPSKMAKHIRQATALPEFDEKNNKECYIIVDGQQRLSSLYSVLNGQKMNETRYNNGIDFKQICLSPGRDKKSEFNFYNTDENSYIKLCDLLNGRLKYETSKNKKKRINECEKAFKAYSFPFIFISGYDEQNMREAFIRLNRGGTSLSSEDKIFALSYSADTDFRRHCAQVTHSLQGGFNNFERKHFLTVIFANLGVKDFISTTSRNNIAKKIKNSNNPYHIEYKNHRKKIFESIKLSAGFLSRKLKDSSYIPYPAMLSILSIFYYNNNNHQPTKEQIKEIERWFWITGFTKRYSGASQLKNQLNDGEEMKKLAKSKKYKINLSGQKRIEPLSMRDLARIRYNQSGAIRNTFFCYLISKKPREFTNAEPLAIGEVSSIFDKKNDHHIFPKNILKKYFYRDDINTVLNICFLSFGENNAIKDKYPWVYLKEFDKDNFRKILDSHALPLKDCLLKKGDIEEKYKAFKKERMLIIRHDLTRLMGEKYIVD